MRRTKYEAPPQEVSVEVDGKTYTGSYTISSKVVTVSTGYGSASTQVGGSTANNVARMLLSEIVRGAKSRGDLS